MIAQSSAWKDDCMRGKDVIDCVCILTAASVDTRYRLPALLIWVAYFVVPNDAGGIVHGIPLGPIEATALLMLAWLGHRPVRALPGAAVVAILLAVTYAAGAAIPGEGGFRARYFANAAATGGHERSTEFPGTRIHENRSPAGLRRRATRVLPAVFQRQQPLQLLQGRRTAAALSRVRGAMERVVVGGFVSGRVSTSTRPRRPDRFSSTARKPLRSAPVWAHRRCRRWR